MQRDERSRRRLAECLQCDVTEVAAPTVSNDRMSRALAAMSKQDRYHAKQFLLRTHSDARTMWPCVESRVRRACAELTLTDCLPKEVFKMGDDHPVRQLFADMFRKIERMGRMHSAETVRKALCFLYGFLFDGDHSLVPTEVKEAGEKAVISEFLKSLTKERIASAFHGFHEHSTRVKQQVSLSHFNRQMYLIDLLFRVVLHSPHVRSGFTASLFGIATSSRRRPGDALSVGSSNSSEAEYGNMASKWIRKPQPRTAGTDGRHYFSSEEVRSLYLACETLFEKMLMLALFTTGMRIGGFCKGKVRGTVDGDGRVGSDWHTIEKRAKPMTYPMTADLRRMLQQWVDEKKHGSEHIFHTDGSRTGHVPPRAAYAVFMAVANRAGLADQPHVHPHTTRHTVAWTLAALGNKAEDIARLVGHESAVVTSKFYIAMTQSDVRKRINVPWYCGGGKKRRSGEDELRATAMELAMAIEGPFGSKDQRTFRSVVETGREESPQRKKHRGAKRRRDHSSTIMNKLDGLHLQNELLLSSLKKVAPPF